MFEPIQIIGVFGLGVVMGIIVSGVLLSRKTKITIRDAENQIELSKKIIKEYETSKN